MTALGGVPRGQCDEYVSHPAFLFSEANSIGVHRGLSGRPLHPFGLDSIVKFIFKGRLCKAFFRSKKNRSRALRKEREERLPRPKSLDTAKSSGTEWSKARIVLRGHAPEWSAPRIVPRGHAPRIDSGGTPPAIKITIEIWVF